MKNECRSITVQFEGYYRKKKIYIIVLAWTGLFQQTEDFLPDNYLYPPVTLLNKELTSPKWIRVVSHSKKCL